MNVLVIRSRHSKTLVAVIEKLEGMSAGACALAWALGEGYKRFPTDCEFSEAPLTTMGSVMRKLMPCDELQKLEDDADQHYQDHVEQTFGICP